MPKPYNVFIVYAREDAQYLKELRGHLRPMERAGMLKIWCDREIDPGATWEQAIIDNMDVADIILLMVSAAYYDSSYIHDKELKYAQMRHEKGEASVIPLIIRPCKFHVDPIVSSLQALPKDARPVTSWNDRDEAWLDIVDGIGREVEKRENAMQDAVRRAVELKQQRKEAEIAEEKRKKREEELKKKHAIQNFDYRMIDVIGGSFIIGSPLHEVDRRNNECQHEVTVRNFQIGKYPVTQKQWDAIMGSNPSQFKDCNTCPVEMVSWNDIQDFIEKLNEKTGMTYRLPTEEEREYAARGVIKVKDSLTQEVIT